MQRQTPTPQPDLDRNRLPTLYEVLSRRTLPPVDLFSFYIYMRDQQKAVDFLDFWLDVAQHMSLCRHYVRELRRSVMIGTPEGEKAASKRSSAILEGLGNMDHSAAGPSMTKTPYEKNQDAQMSAYLREEGAEGVDDNEHSRNGSFGSEQSGIPRTNSHSHEHASRPSFMSSPLEQSDSNSPAHVVERKDLRASAEKILYTYILPGAEREINLGRLNQEIIEAIENENRDDPELFDRGKDYVFQAMERDAFPGFLRWKALGNLVPKSMLFRLVIGLISMFAAFWTSFCLIFLDHPRHTRCWEILPFTIGVYCLTTHQYALDPFMALLGYSEYTFMSFSRVREPYVRKLLTSRALTVLAFWIAITVALCCLFILVPGKRI